MRDELTRKPGIPAIALLRLFLPCAISARASRSRGVSCESGDSAMRLVDESPLLVYPVVLGAGDRLFEETQDKDPDVPGRKPKAMGRGSRLFSAYSTLPIRAS